MIIELIKCNIINRTRSDAYEDLTILYLIFFFIIFSALTNDDWESKEDVGLMTNDLLTLKINSESCNNVDEKEFY